ncbi:hypothetical protein [Patulibacter minatonensis]|uniref:hypothetical protein n=1 Tax=Patulibacter minatonensis TaxID=298163 RepID=UPI00047DED65|nr:hypothetical protein [Patulibacter minatonensis]
MSPAKAIVKRTEGEMIAMLRRRHEQTSGNGDAYAFIPHVRDAAGFDARRTIDGYAMHLWKSRGLTIDAFEIKCSRSDWLRELKDPQKADGFCERADRFWLVVGDAAIVKDGELPPTWGLLVAQGGGDTARLVQKVEAPRLRPWVGTKGEVQPLPPGLDRSFLAALLRAATKTSGVTNEELAAMHAETHEIANRMAAAAIERAENHAARLDAEIKAFEAAAGVSINGWHRHGPDGQATEVGKALRAVLAGSEEVDRLRDHLQRQAQRYREMAAKAEELASPLASTPGRNGGDR